MTSQPTERSGTAVPGDVPQPTGAAPASAADPVDVSRQIAALADAVNQLVREQQQQQQQQQPAPDAAATTARERYARTRLGDLPEAYRRQMPDSADEQQLAEAERVIRRQFREDLRAALGTHAPPDVGGDIPGAGAAAPGANAADVARLSPVHQIALGLRDAKPVGPSRPEVVRWRGADGVPDDSHPSERDAAPVGAD